MPVTSASDVDLQIVERQLSRMPRGVVGVAARCVCGAPLAVATRPQLEDGTPFPTVFYLTQPAAVRGCSTLEAEHWMAELNERLQADEDLADSYRRAHEHYLAARAEYGRVAAIEHVSAGGMPTRVKCLHAILGHTLAAGPGVNPIGDLLIERLASRDLWRADRCQCLPDQRPGDVLGGDSGDGGGREREDAAGD